MSFLAPFLIALAGFAAIPVLLHLIRRRRVRILDLPTFKLLQKAAMQQRLHLRLHDHLLLLLRMLVLLLLALAFAGPLTESAVRGDLPSLGNRTFLVIDDSLSMLQSSTDGRTLFDVAIEAAEDLMERGDTDWRVLFASELGKDSKPSEGPEPQSEPLSKKIERQGEPSLRGSLAPAIDRFAATLAPNDRVWFLSDGSAMNWARGGPTRSATGTHSVQVLLVGEGAGRSNVAITDLQINNEPLLSGEPALISAGLDVFGPSSVPLNPEGISAFWTFGEGKIASTRLPLEATGTRQARVDFAIEYSSEIASVSARVDLAPSVTDPLGKDNSRLLIPRTLGTPRVCLLAHSQIWRDILSAALPGFDVVGPNWNSAPATVESDAAAYVLVLGNEALSQEWNRYLEQRLQAGAGLLVLYDQMPDGVRLENWTSWWDVLGTSGVDVMYLSAGAKTALAGSSKWFAGSLDETARDLEWAEGALPVVVNVNTPARSEWLLRDLEGVPRPVFQVQGKGEGTLAVWGIPLSLDTSPLLLSPGWVPLLSQMVKRTLVDPPLESEDETRLADASESDLTRLSEAELAGLESRGWHFRDAGEVVADRDHLPSARFDWTAICLILCFALAFVEIAVSNYL
jgi:hypothetical protein